MTIFEAILLGIVQGVFMFFPVSSTSHLALLQHYLIEEGSRMPSPASSELILFDLVVHVGTLVSIAIVFRKQLLRAIKGVITEAKNGIYKIQVANSTYLRLVGLSMLSLAATGIIGGFILWTGTGVFDSPYAIAINLIITGLLLWWTDAVDKNSRGPKQLTIAIAIIIGIAQGFALLPGLSRSGLTIAIALYLGVKRKWAATYSFFLAIPTILVASTVQLLIVLNDSEPVLVQPSAFFAGAVMAAIVGTAALTLVLWLLYQAKFRIFSYYVWLLAVLVLLDII